MKVRTKVLIGVGVGLGLLLIAAYVLYGGGELETAGTVHDKPVPKAMVAARAQLQEKARGAKLDKQILFGDLHVHSTFSADAFTISLPLLNGEGAHPPADACDYARFCSSLDFYSMTDHAEALTPRRWAETKKSVRQCNAVAKGHDEPDLVAFTGFEWTQVGRTPAEHYGHKNVIFRDTGEDKLPTRPIAAPGFVNEAFGSLTRSVGLGTLLSIPFREFSDRQRYKDLVAYFREMQAVDHCPEGVDVRKLPTECRESAKTPKDLFAKLKQWGFETLVIPHGTTWGFYTPAGYLWDKQLAPEQDNDDMQRLIEVMSGHGNSEEYRAWLATDFDAQGKATCPATRKNFTPCCQRAAEIIRSRCGNVPKEQCDKRAADAKRLYVEAGTFGHLTVPGASVEDWKDCGQCDDCFVPAFMYRPGGSAQYILARGHFKGAKPRHVVMGFMASSDNHSSRPGTGYKEFARRSVTEATGAKNKEWRERIFGLEGEPLPESIPIGPEQLAKIPPFRVVHAERQASFFLTGGLIAVHSQGRKRGAIWDAMQRREVYGTSGDRILLWFDLINGPDGKKAPMGSELKLGTTPRFTVRAAGAFKQKPGCPDFSTAAVPTDRLKRLCRNECYNPSDERRRITRIEVIRIRPQLRDDEPLEPLIEDVWKKHACPAKASSCEMQFEDPAFVEGKRDVIYYVRAIQEPTPAVNANSVRCERDKAGKCIRARPCYGDYRTPLEDDCLAPNEERAWSSPVYVRFDAAAAKAAADKAAKEAADKEGEKDGGAAGPGKKDG